MNITQPMIYNLFSKLRELASPSLLIHYEEDSRELALQVKDTKIQFIVYAEDTIFRVEIHEGIILTGHDETDDLKTDKPEEVIQAAKAFKFEHL